LKNIFSKKTLAAILRYCLGISFFVYIVLKVDFQHLDFFSVNWTYVALSILPLILFIIFQGVRFNSLLVSPLRFVELLFLQFKMQFFNLVFPGGIGGDAYRVLVLKHAEKSLTSVASKSVVDRLSGLLFTTIMFVWGLPSALMQIEMKDGMLIASWSVVAICLVVSVIALSRYWQGLELLKKGVLLLFFSFLCWAMQVLRLWLLCVAIGLDFSVQGLSFILGILQLASLLPITVGGLGLIEGAFVFATGLLGVASPVAALGAVLMRLTTMVSGLFGFSIWLLGRPS
jgi:uncharacterized membrane protein YbhN (UPF0104 family)